MVEPFSNTVQPSSAAAAFLHGIAARLAAGGAAGGEGPAATARAEGAGAPIGASDLIGALPAATRMVNAAAMT